MDGVSRLTPHVNWRWDVDYTAPLAGLPQVIVPSMPSSLPKVFPAGNLVLKASSRPV